MIDSETRERALRFVAGQSVPQKGLEPMKESAGRGYTAAIKIAVKLIKQFEGLSLASYPDPCSPLSIELTKHGILQKFIDGKLELPPYLAKLSGEPYTAMYGETEGIKQGQVFTIEEAEARLTAKVKKLTLEVIEAVPSLAKLSNEAIAACVSLAYNVGLTAFKNSTVAKCISKGDLLAAGEAFLMWTKAGGKFVQGLLNRRLVEKAVFLSVKA